MEISCSTEDTCMEDDIGDLRIRVTNLESELLLTQFKLSATETAVAGLEVRLEASDAFNAELRCQVSNLYTLLETFRTSAADLPSEGTSGGVHKVVEDSLRIPLSSDDTEAINSKHICDTEAAVGVSDQVKLENDVQVQWTDGAVSAAGDIQVESIADCVRATAESAVVDSSFVFDSQTGLYYDYITGYYYDAEKSLYYEPQSGLYFYFDEISHDYKYHSRVEKTRHNLLTHIIYNRSSTTADDKKAEICRKSKQVLKNSKNVRRSIQKMCKEHKCVEKLQKDIDMVFANRKERRSNNARSELVHCSTNLAVDMVEEITSDINEASHKSVLNAGEGSCSSEESSSEREDGEIDKSDSESSNDDSNIAEIEGPEEMQNCTPCIRAMVAQSDCLQPGTLFVITCMGGTIGRDSNLGHNVVIPDPLISKMHCSVSYDVDRQRYVIKDHASQTGTFINNRRLSKAKTVSGPHVVYHGDLLRLAATTFDLHIHPRSETCTNCEPGCSQKLEKDLNKPDCIVSCEDKELERRRQLKKLRKKFGLESMQYEDHPSLHCKASDSYLDRAAERRQTVGSELPFDMCRVEPASVHRPITEKNIGHKMLSKMGWKEGEGLGKNRDDAILEPINVDVRLKQTAGLGAYSGTQLSLDDVSATTSSARWIKAQDRYAKLSSSSQPTRVNQADISDILLDIQPTAEVTQTAMGPIKWSKSSVTGV